MSKHEAASEYVFLTRKLAEGKLTVVEYMELTAELLKVLRK